MEYRNKLGGRRKHTFIIVYNYGSIHPCFLTYKAYSFCYKTNSSVWPANKIYFVIDVLILGIAYVDIFFLHSLVQL
jgi:hypothetical protein